MTGTSAVRTWEGALVPLFYQNIRHCHSDVTETIVAALAGTEFSWGRFLIGPAGLSGRLQFCPTRPPDRVFGPGRFGRKDPYFYGWRNRRECPILTSRGHGS